MDDHSLQQVLARLNKRDLSLALKHTSEKLTGKIFENISSGSARNLREDMKALAEIPHKQIEEAQQRIMVVVCQLEERGEIVICRDDSGDSHAYEKADLDPSGQTIDESKIDDTLEGLDDLDLQDLDR